MRCCEITAAMDVVESLSEDTADLPSLVPADDMTGGMLAAEGMTDEEFAQYLSDNPDAMQ